MTLEAYNTELLGHNHIGSLNDFNLTKVTWQLHLDTTGRIIRLRVERDGYILDKIYSRKLIPDFSNMF